jgi:DtxR family transcriptional regulator, Mn-dependent transcriptional regulator
MAPNDKLSNSLEDYLETIYLVVREQGSARSRDITSRLQVTPSSVTEALRALDARGLINYVPYGLITLTPAGEVKGSEIFHRHETLRDFFVEVLGVDPAAADSGACRIEHVISAEILESMGTGTNMVRLSGRTAAGRRPAPSGEQRRPEPAHARPSSPPPPQHQGGSFFRADL